jgi:P pilus assembly chaperone PapD
MPAFAKLSLNNVIVDIPGTGERFRDIEATNTGEDTLYLDVTVREVLQPGEASEQRRPVNLAEDRSLIVTPNKTVLPPGARRLIRFMAMGAAPGRERVYRVSVTPVIAGVEAKQTALKILVAYDVLVLVRPAVLSASGLKVQRSGATLKVENAGENSVFLQDIRQCAPGTEQSPCPSLTSKRLYPGNSWSYALPHDAAVEIQQTVGDDTTVERYP